MAFSEAFSRTFTAIKGIKLKEEEQRRDQALIDARILGFTEAGNAKILETKRQIKVNKANGSDTQDLQFELDNLNRMKTEGSLDEFMEVESKTEFLKQQIFAEQAQTRMFQNQLKEKKFQEDIFNKGVERGQNYAKVYTSSDHAKSGSGSVLAAKIQQSATALYTSKTPEDFQRNQAELLGWEGLFQESSEAASDDNRKSDLEEKRAIKDLTGIDTSNYDAMAPMDRDILKDSATAGADQPVLKRMTLPRRDRIRNFGTLTTALDELTHPSSVLTTEKAWTSYWGGDAASWASSEIANPIRSGSVESVKGDIDKAVKSRKATKEDLNVPFDTTKIGIKPAKEQKSIAEFDTPAGFKDR